MWLHEEDEEEEEEERRWCLGKARVALGKESVTLKEGAPR